MQHHFELEAISIESLRNGSGDWANLQVDLNMCFQRERNRMRSIFTLCSLSFEGP